MRIAEVAFNIPLERTFHYLIPDAMQPTLQAGMRVAAPFGPRELTGFVVQRVAHSPIPELKRIRRVWDPVPMVTGERWALAEWMSRHYAASFGEALAAMVPSALRLRPTAERAASPGGTTEPPRVLLPQQQKAFDAIEKILETGTHRTVLLHGVTGSGKTEIYLQAIARALAAGKTAICLIPEIGLTPQTLDRFRARFGATVAVWHSRLTASQRAAEWQRMLQGEARVVIGARSAVFAPLPRLGVIVVDEEHEATYKQEDTPRYHARDVARRRAELTDALLLLGSATPAVESAYAAREGEDTLLTLPQRVQGRPLPEVDIVDMREELTERHRRGPLSARLERALGRAIERGEQVILLLNRRGFARSTQCQACGVVRRCRRCSVPLIYHAGRQQLVCHYCNAQETPPEMCPACGKGYLKYRGSGTERIESELHRLFPAASIGRMDRDTTKGRDSHRTLYEAMASRQIGLLVGTQMVAKGHDFPQVTLVGVVSADTALNLPDFRAGERTFDLLTQVAGRAGRGEQPGAVVIQTYCPTHYAIQAARLHDYERFYQEEITSRRQLQLPPFSRLVELTIHGSSQAKVEEAAQQLADALRKQGGRRITLLGPAPHRIARLRRTYRMCLLLKGAKVEPMVELVRKTLQPGRRFAGLPVTVDVEPL